MSYGEYDPNDDPERIDCQKLFAQVRSDSPEKPPLLPDNAALRMIGSAFLGLFVLTGIGCVIALIIAAITAK